MGKHLHYCQKTTFSLYSLVEIWKIVRHLHNFSLLSQSQDRLRLRFSQINLENRSACTIFALAFTKAFGM